MLLAMLAVCLCFITRHLRIEMSSFDAILLCSRYIVFPEASAVYAVLTQYHRFCLTPSLTSLLRSSAFER